MLLASKFDNANGSLTTLIFCCGCCWWDEEDDEIEGHFSVDAALVVPRLLLLF